MERRSEMKLTCDMVTDLYPLYKDGLASEDSRAAIKEHLRTCDECRNFFRRYPFRDKLLRRSAAVANDNSSHLTSAADGFLSIAKKLRRNRNIRVSVIAAIALIVSAFTFYKFFWKDKD